MHRLLLSASVAMTAVALSTVAALADDWVVTKARGTLLQMIEGQWQPLARGDVVPDDRAVKTLGDARAELVRGKETLELGPNTQVQIHDKGGSRPFTTVQEYYGDVGVDAEVRNVRHFAVQTPFIAAVVKGTHFEVVSGAHGSTVSVQRGHVWVGQLGTNRAVTIAAGQQASAGPQADLAVSATGEADAASPAGARSLSVGVAGVASASAGSGGVSVNALGPSGVSVQAGGGEGLGVQVGGSGGITVQAGGGEGVSVGVGGAGVSVSGDGIGVDLGGLHLGLGH